ncbi:MAG: alpha/beta fold hydrolase [Caulobacteraceae bacterium]
MRARIGLFALGWLLVLLGGLLAHLIQTSGGTRVEDVRYPGPGGTVLSALLFIPASASAARPAPAVLVSHGYINTREMQSPFAIELSRRGFVVLAIDMTGHGFSGGAVGAFDGGGPAGLRYLQRLPFVDKANIGLEGHSMGGVPVVGAALSQPNGYRSMVLEGSTTPEIGQLGAGTPTFPHDLAVVFGQYDEFAPLMWHVDRGSRVAGSAKLETLFGARAPVVPDRLYGAIAAGTARLLANPPITHPMEHFSTAGIGAAVDWFQRTLAGAASPRPAGDQIWPWKEAGTLIALAGFVVLLLGTFDGLLALPPFAALRHEPTPAAERRGWRWRLAFVLTAAVPALTFYLFMNLGFAFLPTRLFPEWVTNQLVVWALLSGAISLVLSLLLRGGRPRFDNLWVRSAGIALMTVAVGYLALMVSDALFKTDFRFWVIGLKPLDPRHFAYFLAYLPLFAVFFLIAFRALHANLAVEGESAPAQLLTAAAALSAGFVVLIGAQYASLFTTGLLISPSEALDTIIALQFVPLLAVVGLIGAYAFRRTNSYVPGALICALVVTWYVVAGTATHWSPGWSPPRMAGLYPARPEARS